MKTICNTTQCRRIIGVLRKIRKLFTRRGSWCQGVSHEYKWEGNEFNYNHIVSYCLVGAIQHYMDSYETKENISSELAKTIGKPDGGFPVIVRWNDMPSRRKRDVLRLIDKTIKRLSHER